MCGGVTAGEVRLPRPRNFSREITSCSSGFACAGSIFILISSPPEQVPPPKPLEEDDQIT